MKTHVARNKKGWPWHMLILAIFLVALFSAHAHAFTLNVVGPNGEPVTQYRWLVEEDATYRVNPGEIDPYTLGVSFHRSYMPVVAKGDETTPPTGVVLDPTKHYFVSVLPDADYTIGGAPLPGDQAAVTVTCNALPLPTAQITVFVFEDNQPVNNAPDLPEETGLEGFEVIIDEAGGRYGQSGGRMMLDAFGNPLGTTYNPDGSVATMGTGTILTDANGEAVIKNLPPGKYGVRVIPPPGEEWIQTTTIEGTPTIDAWVKANEPAYFREFGPPSWHVFMGFIRPTFDTAALDGDTTVTGQIINLHLSRPPDYAFNDGAPFGHTTPWVGLNDLAGGVGTCIFAQRCNEDGTFSIPNVPPGSYQLVVWDDYLDIIIAFLGLTVPEGGGELALGNVPVFNWFTALQHYVFYDDNENGFWDDGEVGLPEQAVNLRWRDGTIYQSFPTDGEGFVPFDEIFPFFAWLVAEVDFLRYKATGVTVVVDNGGPINPADPWSFGGVLNPQPQSENGNLPYRTETGPSLTQAFQGFLGQTSVMLWGKKEYGPGENGGISGVVYYATTRAEDDPRYAAAETWEPGIPRVQVNLYQDTNNDQQIDDINGVAGVQLADVDNFPFDWSAGGAMGPEDIERSGNDNVFDFGDAIEVTTTDSWDDSIPTGCQGEIFYVTDAAGNPVATDCFDGLRNFNQVRPGVFDGGYAFGPELDDGSYLPSGMYIVEAVPPSGYEVVKEEDKNVDFGDTYYPAFLPPICVGDDHIVPPELSLFPGIEAPYANLPRPLCNLKQVALTEGRNAAVDFFLFTEVPVAGHLYGFILDDTANEFDPNSPQFGEKYAPPWLPVSIRDWTGREISRVYSDRWGVYNALVPSTYTVNIPAPSGVSPNMITVCLNHPGPIPDPDNPGMFITDPFFNPQYSQFCYTFQYMPGTTTYLDTPVVPTAAFAGPDQFPLDCNFADGTPVINWVTDLELRGPYVPSTPSGIMIYSAGPTEVPNPEYDGPNGTNPKTIIRDYGFGSVQGSVTVNGQPLTITQWSANGRLIRATVPNGVTTGQLVVTRGDNGKSTVMGVTLTVGGPEPFRVYDGGSIQAAIDGADPGDLILVGPGTYDEKIIMWKPVRLQGWGAGSVFINAFNEPAEKLAAWRQKVEQLVLAGDVDLLPAQEIGFGGAEPDTLFTEEGAGIIVLAKNATPAQGGFGQNPRARIDGFTIYGADFGGGIVVNGYAHYLEISNNRVQNNAGFFHGGVRVGHPTLTVETPDGLDYQSGFNDHIRIHHNHITQNGGLGGSGGGLSLCTGSDLYEVTDNVICGNFSMGDGAGIGHIGLSDGGRIVNNKILFNQSFNQGLTVSGGGLSIAGGAPLGGPGSLSPGSGSVLVDSNLFHGNLAGAGDGGAIRLTRVNGQDLLENPTNPLMWYSVDILNNMIQNNVAGFAGGGISLQDVVRTTIIHNTIANNDSTATAGEAFTPGVPSESNPQPAGIVARAHSDDLAGAIPPNPQLDAYRVFSNPVLWNNIIWHNRSFYFIVDDTQDPPFYGLLPDVGAGDPPVYDDLAVLGATGSLDPRYCILTDTAGYDASNLSADPMLAAEYPNAARNSVIIPEITTSIQAAAAFDEGGNFIDVRFGPLTLIDPQTGQLFVDSHLQTGSPAENAGGIPPLAVRRLIRNFAELLNDYDGQNRPSGPRPDAGSDEYYP
ncbi:MAG: hypothetical protein Kow0099_15200 [Candidatus Abyssubacteria bacterium]